MQTVEQLADCFFTNYPKEDVDGGWSRMCHERLCDQVRDLIVEHVNAALEIASFNVIVTEEYEYDGLGNEYLIAKVNRDSILNAYPLTNIK